MHPAKFDELTKVLATSSSRRQALRRIGVILGGMALAEWLPGVARADNSVCAHFCSSAFGANTPAADQCASDAAHHTGLCYSCGPASLGGTQSICCPKNPDGTCTSYSSTTCCPSGTVCLAGGQCVSMCQDGVKDGQETDVDCGGPVCPSCADGMGCLVSTDCQSRVCVNGRCAAPTCNDGVKNGQETDKDCGGPVCPRCGNLQRCLVNSDCQSGNCQNGICLA